MATRPLFTLTGTKRMGAHMRSIAERAPKKFGQQLRLQGEQIMTLSKRDFVPIDDSDLMKSGIVTGPFIDGQGRDAQGRFTTGGGSVGAFGLGDIAVVMAFGGSAAAYAAAIHEHPSSASPPSWEGKVIKFNRSGGSQRGVKYLERPMRFRSIGVAGRIARGVLL